MIALLFLALLQTPAAMRTIDKGAESAIDSPRQAVARTADEWQKLWRQHSWDRQAPPIDFAKEMVVGVFLGSRTTAGYSVTIDEVSHEGGKLIVKYRERSPGRGTVTAQVITAPYHLVAVPRTTGDIEFERIQ